MRSIFECRILKSGVCRTEGNYWHVDEWINRWDRMDDRIVEEKRERKKGKVVRSLTLE